jgi:hypothetical protein
MSARSNRRERMANSPLKAFVLIAELSIKPS